MNKFHKWLKLREDVAAESKRQLVQRLGTEFFGQPGHQSPYLSDLRGQGRTPPSNSLDWWTGRLLPSAGTEEERLAKADELDVQ